MNILFCMNNYPDSRNGGIENVTRILSEQFVKLGHIVHIRYLLDSKFAHSDDSIFQSCEQIEKKDISRQIKDIVATCGIDFIINQGIIHASPLIRDAITDFKCKLITAFHGQPTLNPPPLRDTIVNSKISIIKRIIILLTYPLFLCMSKRKQKRSCQKSYFASDYTVLLSKLHIPEYSEMMEIDTSKLLYFNNPLRNNTAFETFERDNKENTVLIVTRISEKEKCIIKSLKIWEKTTKNFPNWKLQIVGSGPDEEKIKKYAIKHKIKNVEFHPAQNPESFYKKASLFLMTSRSEGWGCTLTEAMQFGCIPIAIGTYTAIRDIIDNEENGIIVPKSSHEIESCASAISKLIKDEEFRKNMAVNAYNKSKRFTAEVIARQWITFLEKAISEHDN